jgi:hypothetical protein
MLRFLKPHLLPCSLYCWKALDEVHLSWFHNVFIFGGEVIEYGTISFTKNMFKSNLNFIGEFWYVLDIVGKPLMSRI